MKNFGLPCAIQVCVSWILKEWQISSQETSPGAVVGRTRNWFRLYKSSLVHPWQHNMDMRSTHFSSCFRKVCNYAFSNKNNKKHPVENHTWHLFAKLSLTNPPMVSNCNLSREALVAWKNITTLHLEFHTCTSAILVVAGWKKMRPALNHLSKDKVRINKSTHINGNTKNETR